MGLVLIADKAVESLAILAEFTPGPLVVKAHDAHGLIKTTGVERSVKALSVNTHPGVSRGFFPDAEVACSKGAEPLDVSKIALTQLFNRVEFSQLIFKAAHSKI